MTNPLAQDATFTALVNLALERQGNFPAAFAALIRAGKIASAYVTDGSQDDGVLWGTLMALERSRSAVNVRPVVE